MSKEEIFTKFQNEIMQLKKENEGTYILNFYLLVTCQFFFLEQKQLFFIKMYLI